MRHTTTLAAFFSLVYGAEGMFPIEVMVPSARLVLLSKLIDLHDYINDIEALDERRHNKENRWFSYQKHIIKSYNKRVRPRTFSVADLVLMIIEHLQKGLSASRFALEWEGPYIFQEAYDNCYFLITRPNYDDILAPINGKWLKLYYLNIQSIVLFSFYV